MQVAMAGIAGAMAGFPALDPIAGGLVGLMIAKTGGEMVHPALLSSSLCSRVWN